MQNSIINVFVDIFPEYIVTSWYYQDKKFNIQLTLSNPYTVTYWIGLDIVEYSAKVDFIYIGKIFHNGFDLVAHWNYKNINQQSNINYHILALYNSIENEIRKTIHDNQKIIINAFNIEYRGKDAKRSL